MAEDVVVYIVEEIEDIQKDVQKISLGTDMEIQKQDVTFVVRQNINPEITASYASDVRFWITQKDISDTKMVIKIKETKVR